jgi:hypothetical protein
MEKPYWRKKFPITTTRLSFGNDLCAIANLAGDPLRHQAPSSIFHHVVPPLSPWPSSLRVVWLTKIPKA